MLPFSFAEYYKANETKDKNQAFMEYLNMGSFPVVITQLGSSMELSDQYLEGIYNTIIIKDVVTRKGVSDIGLLKNIVKFLCSNVGSSVSIANITDYINNSGRKITQKTVDKYVKALVDSFLFYHVERYNIRGKNLLKTLGKYYIVARQNSKEYYQVAMTALHEEVRKRELDPLKKVSDNYPKYLITLDFVTGDDEGIKQVNLVDWLLGD